MILLALAALAASPLGYGTYDATGNPPPRFRGDATVKVHFVSRTKLHAVCGRDSAACQSDNEIWVRNPCRQKGVGDLSSLDSDLCHEKGHVLGWPGNHPYP